MRTSIYFKSKHENRLFWHWGVPKENAIILCFWYFRSGFCRYPSATYGCSAIILWSHDILWYLLGLLTSVNVFKTLCGCYGNTFYSTEGGTFFFWRLFERFSWISFDRDVVWIWFFVLRIAHYLEITLHTHIMVSWCLENFLQHFEVQKVGQTKTALFVRNAPKSLYNYKGISAHFAVFGLLFELQSSVENFLGIMRPWCNHTHTTSLPKDIQEKRSKKLQKKVPPSVL